MALAFCVRRQEVLGIPVWLTPESLILGSPTNQLGKDCRLRQVVVLLDRIGRTPNIVLSHVSSDDRTLSNNRTCFLDKQTLAHLRPTWLCQAASHARGKGLPP